MSDTIKLQEQITSFLKTKCSRVYLQEAPQNAVFPYVVYDLPNSSLSDANREDFSLEIDVWDNSQDTTALEILVGNIDGNGNILNASGLHRKMFFVNGALWAKCYRESRLSIRDEDSRIKRRQLRYTVQTYL